MMATGHKYISYGIRPEPMPGAPGTWRAVTIREIDLRVGISASDVWMASNGSETHPIADWRAACWSLTRLEREMFVVYVSSFARRIGRDAEKLVSEFPWRSVILNGFESDSPHYQLRALAWVGEGEGDIDVVAAVGKLARRRNGAPDVMEEADHRHRLIARRAAGRLRRALEAGPWETCLWSGRKSIPTSPFDALLRISGCAIGVDFHFVPRVSAGIVPRYKVRVSEMHGVIDGLEAVGVIFLTEDGSATRDALASVGATAFVNGLHVSETFRAVSAWVRKKTRAHRTAASS